jgi:hypothetical protein
MSSLFSSLAYVFLGALMCWWLIITNNTEEYKKFEVVDKYKSCDVVKYNVKNTFLIDNHYFLDCSKNDK